MTSECFDFVGGYKLPAIGLGTYAVTDEEKLTKALNVALETGYRHIDTAFYYRNERIIGNVLKEWFDSGKLKREDVFVTTKLPGAAAPDEVDDFIISSLKDLQLDYVDLYLIHMPMRFVFKPGMPSSEIKTGKSDIVATWKKLEKLVQVGRAKSIGISNFNQDQVGRILKNANIIPATNQIELHPYLQQPELVKYCQDNGVVVVSYHSLGNPGLPTWMAANNMKPIDTPDLLNDPVVKRIATKHNKTAAQVLLRFMNQKGVAVIPKSVTPSRIRENFDIFSFSLDSDDLRELEKLDKGARGRITWFERRQNDEEYPFGKKP